MYAGVFLLGNRDVKVGTWKVKGKGPDENWTSHLELRFQEGHVQNLTVFVKHFENRPCYQQGRLSFVRLFIVFADMKIVHKRNLKNLEQLTPFTAMPF